MGFGGPVEATHCGEGVHAVRIVRAGGFNVGRLRFARCGVGVASGIAVAFARSRDACVVNRRDFLLDRGRTCALDLGEIRPGWLAERDPRHLPDVREDERAHADDKNAVDETSYALLAGHADGVPCPRSERVVKGLHGKVAVVDDGGGPIGRAVALALAAQGAQVVVSGPVERSLGETVGEIAYGGGKARHVVGDPRAAAARAQEVFGPVDIVVATRVECTLPDAARTVVVTGDVDSDEIGALVASVCLSKAKTRRVTIEAPTEA